MAADFDQCRFAECLQKYEAIWNDKSKDHANRAERKEQIKALAEEYGITRKYAMKYMLLLMYFADHIVRVATFGVDTLS